MTKLICTFGFFLISVSLMAQKQKTINIPLEPSAWEFSAEGVEFIQHKGMAAAKIVSDTAKLVAKGIDFSNGTIEFDVESLQPPFTGIYFRRQNDAESEYFYLRVQRAGFPLAIDAVQYAPFVKHVLLWDMLGYYQGPAQLRKNEWNHVKMVVSGMQMLVYVNDMNTPALQIPRLEGNTKSGSIALSGRSVYANVVVKPGDTGGLSPVEGFDPTYHDSRYLRKWQVTTPSALPFGRDVAGSDLPNNNTAWSTISAERRGLVNLTRLYGIDTVRRIVWLKTTIKSEKEQIRNMKLGFSDEAWVVVNGQLAYADKNWYGVPIMKEPDGRCSIENSSVPIMLKQGDNEILIGVTNFFFGWGIIARFDKVDGLSF